MSPSPPPFHLAFEKYSLLTRMHGKQAIVRAGGSVEHRNMHGAAPLHAAALSGNHATVQWFLDRGFENEVND